MQGWGCTRSESVCATNQQLTTARAGVTLFVHLVGGGGGGDGYVLSYPRMTTRLLTHPHITTLQETLMAGLTQSSLASIFTII